MSHEFAPVTRLVATRCCLCGRELADAVSLERGVGPVCAQRYGADEPQVAPNWSRAGAQLWAGGIPVETLDALITACDARRLANAALYRVSAAPDAPEAACLVEGIRALGFVTLAERLTERLAEEGTVTVRAEGAVYCVAAPFNPAFNEALREAAPSRRWDREARVWRVPAADRAGLWRAIRTAFRGHVLVTDEGTRLVA